jgi:endonuclease VIII
VRGGLARSVRRVPEGHTIHRLAERHRTLFAGKRVAVSSPQGRFAADAAIISGAVLRDAQAYGKHLLHTYAGGRTVHMHLGLYGRITDGSGAPPPPVGAVRLRLATARHWLDLRGPAACELLDQSQVRALVARLGADPLRPDADPGRAYARISRSTKLLAALLLDQSIVAGAGIIFVTEVLFRAGLPLTLPGRDLDEATWGRIWADLADLMSAGVAAGRIDTVHSRHMPDAMGRAPRTDRHGGEVYVYRRAGMPCLVCGTEISRGRLTGRNTYWCPTCQQ